MQYRYWLDIVFKIQRFAILKSLKFLIGFPIVK